MLEVSHLAKQYPTPRGNIAVLDAVTFSLAPGDAAAIMGPSGSGKSTLLYALGALEPPTSGTVRLNGTDPFLLPPRALANFRGAHVGFVFQDHCLLPQCTVLENVLIPTLVSPAEERGETDERARMLIDRVGLTDRIDHRPGQLSGGERQRVALARALVRRPTLLLCDEPTGNLDQTSASAIASMLIEMHQAQRTILVIVTHSASLAEKMPIRFELTAGRLRPSTPTEGP